MPEPGKALDGIADARRAAGLKTLVPFLTAGYPDRRTFALMLGEVAAAGCPLVEIGIPFSDPVADGPVIQAASQQALASGVTLAGVLEMAAGARAEHGLGVVLMGYLNPILKFGAERFAAACAEAKVAGLIVPDLPNQEADALRAVLGPAGVTLIDLIAPTTNPERLRVLGARSRGFLYLVSSLGVTGSRRQGDLSGYVARVRRSCAQPLYVGFGVSGPEDAVEICRHADGVVVGSALLRILTGFPDRSPSDREVAAERAGRFLREIARALSTDPGGA